MMKSIAICTVVYNEYGVLDEFFQSLRAQTDTNFRAYVADLSSKPQQYVYPSFVTAFRSDNKGYAHGVNEGIWRAKNEGATRFVVINSDVILEKHFVEQVQKSLDEHPSSIIGGKIYYAPGFEFHNDRYTKEDLGNVLWFAGGRIDWDHAYTFHIGVDEIDKGQYDTGREVDFITGCCMAYDDTVVNRIGDWDDSYFLYYEDTDYCVRASHKGIKLFYSPSIVLWHKNAQSTGGSGSELHRKYQERNRLKFGLKYAPLRTKLHLAKNAILASLSAKEK